MPRGNKSLPAPAPKKKPATASPSPRKGRKTVAKPAPAAAASPPKLISPSRIARYFFQECPRYLRYSSTPKELWAVEGVPEPPFDHSPVTTAILEGGYTWEEEVVANRLKGRVFIAEAKPDTRLKDRVWGASETRRILTGMKPGESIYQPTLITPPSFYARYGIDSKVVEMTDCRPDLIVCEDSEDGPVLRIVNIKASPGLKLSHRIQAALYTLILRHVLEDWGDARNRVDDAAGIWLAQADEAELFDTRSIRPPLENFLEREVQPLLERPADQAPWHVYYRCEWCPYFEHCRAEMTRTDDISRRALPLHVCQAIPGLAGSPGADAGRFRAGPRRSPAAPGPQRLRLAPRSCGPPSSPGPGHAGRSTPGPRWGHARHAEAGEHPAGHHGPGRTGLGPGLCLRDPGPGPSGRPRREPESRWSTWRTRRIPSAPRSWSASSSGRCMAC